jgi:hypothetical protein
MPRLRNFDTEPHSSYCYEVESDKRLESVANAHTAADLHVPPRFSNRAGLKSVGAANVLRDTSCPISRNENDSARVPAKTTSGSQSQAVHWIGRGKVLKLRGDSKHATAVTFQTAAQNKFIIRLRLSAAQLSFQTTGRRYADK